MDIKKVLCDVQGCKAEDAIRFSIFKERRANGAGSMENWNWVFDLCPKHIIFFLKGILEHMPPDAASTLLNEHVIVARTE